jgi:threonine dehydrogenase-like Zn-dependent dehydrogenase
MKAVTWHGKHDVRVDNVNDPEILNPRDAIIKVTSTAICGSDLHLYNGYIPAMRKGDILGHEFMGEVVDTGKGVANLKKGDRVIVPFPIACGGCFHCKVQEYSLCDNSNPNAYIAEQMYGYTGAALFGYSHIYGGYAGGQAEYARVPFADIGPMKVPEGLSDDEVLFLTDILPTGYQAIEQCGIKGGEVVAVWGCGPVGLFAIKSAFLLGASRVIAIDRIPERLAMARDDCGADVLNYEFEDVIPRLKEMTGGRGPDVAVDAVGMEAHGFGVLSAYDTVKQKLSMQTDRPTALRQVIQACRKGGTVSIPGVYGGVVDKLNMGAAFGKALTFKMGQTHVKRYLPELMQHIQNGRLDTTFLITHRASLDDAPSLYDTFMRKQEECIKVVLKTNGVSETMKRRETAREVA